MVKNKESHDQKETQQHLYKLIVWNDEVNTFDHVINCLMKYCGHLSEQAQQCTLTIHYKGKCEVKRGETMLLINIWNHLTENNISTTLESPFS